MRFAQKAKRERRESIVPMINVVFLLLVFLLLTAQMAAPPPLDVTPPVASLSDTATPDTVLHVAADGSLALNDLRGEAALAAIPPGGAVYLRVDANLAAAELAALLPRLAKADQLHLITVAE